MMNLSSSVHETFITAHVSSRNIIMYNKIVLADKNICLPAQINGIMSSL